MAASILSHVVSDLCIGKPAVRVLPPSTPIAAALATLRAGADPFVFVDAAPPDAKKAAALSVVKVSVAEILCYVCGDGGNLGDPAAALRRPVSVLTAVVGDHGVTRRVDPQTSLLDAIDALLANNSHSLLVPLHARARKKHHHASAGYCVLTQQDIVRHLFGSISLFAPVAALSVASLGLVRRDDAHAVHVDDDALDAIPLLQRSIGHGTAVAVVADDDALVGEICPGVLGSCDDVESVSAAFAALSAGDAMTYIDCYFSPPEFLLRSIRAELTDKGLHAMCDLMDAAYTTDVAALSSSSTSSDEECLPLAPARRARKMSSGSFRWRSTEDVAACHAGSSLVAVMAQALAHRVGHVWVVDELTGALVGVVSCADVLAVLRDHLRPECYADDL
ncbi:CBS domain-containing protein CBSX5-like [Triticum urartu]|uniref:CBS domain-containing protein n=1 Tax=Triticum urartu TaxID=4572 RepID=A0A8R7UVW3_TRIUA|nr:CBS domain-containing protein CBSX5-like [Triticum urartu]